MKNPNGAAFVADIMRRVEAKNATELAAKLGDPWTRPNPLRKLYKWSRGEQAPNFEGTLALLRVAGLLRENGAAIPHQAQHSADDLLDKALEEIGAVLERLVIRVSEREQQPAAATSRRKQ